MPILQALNQFVPGRVTRRFAYERGALSHWVPVDPAFPEQHRRISDYALEHEFVGSFTGTLNDRVGGPSLLVFRPWTIRLERAARTDALPSSNARLLWQSDIAVNGDALSVPVPIRSEWRRHIKAIDFHLHRFRSSISVRRFAATAQANVRTLQDDFPVTLHFDSDDGRPGAVGFELEVDGFRLDVAFPKAVDFSGESLPSGVLATSKLAYMRDLIRLDHELPDDLNVFQRDWLIQFLFSALFSDAANNDRPLADTIAELLHDDQIEDVFRSVMDEVFGAIPTTLPDTDDTENSDTDEDQEVGRPGASTAVGGGRLQQALMLQLARPIVRERLRAHATQLVAVNATAFNSWLRRMLLETLGEAMLQACVASAPRQATVDNLLVDIRDDAASEIASVWISETTLGGAGVLEAFADRFASEPRLFFFALEAALVPTDLELVDGGLREILELCLDDPVIAEQVARLRATNSHGERSILWQALSHQLAQRGGIDLSHALSVSLNSRLLRAGSGPQLDRLLIDLQLHWDATETRFGIAIGLREYAFIASRDSNLAFAVRAFLAATLPAAAITHLTVLSAITSMLWPRANEVRLRALQSYNPFRESRSTDPAVVRHLLLNRTIATITFDDPSWEMQLAAAFEAHGTARLSAEVSQSAQLRSALVQIVTTPVSVGVLQFFPVVERVERAGGRIFMTLTLREQV